MSRIRGRVVVLGGLIVALVVATALTMLARIDDPTLSGVDGAMMGFTRSWADAAGWPVTAAYVIGRITAPLWPGVLVAVTAALLWSRGYPAAAGMLAWSGAAGFAATSAVKVLVERPRPAALADYPVPASASFPSGHASAGIYLILALGLVLWRLGRTRRVASLTAAGCLLIVIGPLIGATRLVLGVHWPSDVVAGWAFGSAAVCAAALLLWERLAAQWDGSPPQSAGAR